MSEARQIHHIPARRALTNRAAEARLIRLAVYCRVSTDEEDQLESFANQQAYYQRYVRNHPEYQLVDIFADEGITGLNTRKRDQFKRMIEECEAGHVDMIITKSISRMFRNTADCLLYTRELKKRGIGVLFEEQNINTLDSTGELMLTILSSLAQDESRNISENTTWGIRSRFQQGHLHLNTNRFLGYDKDKDGNLIINPDQAKLVRRIYDSFLDGISPDTIASQFRNEKIPTIMGTSNWQASTIYGILRNEKYKGDVLLQKWYTSDFLSGTTVRNNGEVEQYYIKGTKSTRLTMACGTGRNRGNPVAGATVPKSSKEVHIMPKTTFACKPCTLDDVRIGAAQIERRHGGEALDSYYVAEEIQLEENAFFELLENLLADRDWCREFSNQLHPAVDGAVPAIRVSCRGSLTVLIIDPQGFDYPRYVGLEQL